LCLVGSGRLCALAQVAAPVNPDTSSPAAQTPGAQQPGTTQPSVQPGDQQPGVVSREGDTFTLRTTSFLVRLNASVVDSAGRTVDSLPESAFKVYEDGVAQTIVGFRHEDVPVSLGILIDNSGSMYDKIASVDAASLDLVKLSNPQDEAFLVDFSSEPYLDQDFTGDIAKLQRGLSYIKPGGGTAMYDAVLASADHLAKGAKHPKQVILIITDGDDNASGATLETTIRRVQDLNGPAIYCIGLLFGEDVSRNEAKHSREVLTELAENTGGQAYFPKSLKEVDGIAQMVAQDIRTQYTIEYRSSKPLSVPGFREIHVEAKEKGFHGLQVRTRSGYFPKPAASE
jgi:VWFA-related protein